MSGVHKSILSVFLSFLSQIDNRNASASWGIEPLSSAFHLMETGSLLGFSPMLISISDVLVISLLIVN